jgi:murein DD-endopeptidase MepM/ murein hydrolase activator NlpD
MTSVVRKVLAAVVAAAMLVSVTAPAAAQTGDDAAEQAAREIAAARERANQAAEDFFAAESRLELLLLEQERLQLELADLAGEVADLKRAVEFVAVNRFVSSGASGIPILTDLRAPTEQLHGDVLATVVADSGATTLDDYEEARSRLRDKEDELEDTEAALENQKQELVQLQSDAEAEVDRLRQVEGQRLQDEAVAAALAAQQREEARQLAELERRRAEAARVAAANAGGVAAPVSAGSSDGNTTGNQGPSGGEAGGRTGGGGVGTNPRAAGAGFLDQTMICPILGGSAYGDTWGAPRSGGRRHQGVDMLAPTGTPLQAVIGGFVSQRDNTLGGITISMQGDNGNRYYYAHLSAYEGEGGRVEQGDVIGYIGDTGNATGVPHLHFEIRPNGGVPMNPYPSVRAAGC